MTNVHLHLSNWGYLKNVAITFYKESSKKNVKLYYKGVGPWYSHHITICLGCFSILRKKTDRSRELDSLEQANLSLDYYMKKGNSNKINMSASITKTIIWIKRKRHSQTDVHINSSIIFQNHTASAVISVCGPVGMLNYFFPWSISKNMEYEDCRE